MNALLTVVGVLSLAVYFFCTMKIYAYAVNIGCEQKEIKPITIYLSIMMSLMLSMNGVVLYLT